MLCALLLVLGVIAAVAVATWPNIRRAVQGAGGDPAGQSAPGAGAPQRTPQTLEGLLTIQLVAGEITGPQYRKAMASIAARDAERHPLEVPPEASPPEAA